MSSVPSSSPRLLPASVFILVSLAGLYFMDIIGLIRDFPSPIISGFIEWPGNRFPIRGTYHWASFLDPVVREITPGFAPSSFGYDDVSRWQVMNFLIPDAGIFYAIWGCESLRRGVRGGPASYPGIFALIAQFGGGACIIPIYYFAFMAFTAPVRSRPLSERKIAISGSIIWALLVALLDVVPAVGMMFDSTLEARDWWVWFWQLYPVRITLSWYAIQFLGQFVKLPTLQNTLSYRTKIALVLAPFIALAVGLWAYTLLYCPYPLFTVFFPQEIIEDTWVMRMRRVLQMDQAFVFGSSVLWVAMDLRRNSLAGVIGVLGVLVTGVMLAGAVGTGASFALLWLWREWQLVDYGEKDEAKAE